MKKILCTTDFSRPDAKVCKYAAHLAKLANAQLYLLHATQPSAIRPIPDFDIDYAHAYNETKLKRMARNLSTAVGGGISIKIINKTGFAAEVITETAKEIRPDLLVMSTVGELPLTPGVIGNLSSAMIGRLQVPLMLVPHKVEFKSFENVYMAVDVNEKIDALALQQMLNTLKAFKVIINIFSVVDNPEAPEVKEAVLTLREMLKEYPHVIDVVKGDNFVEAFLVNSQIHKADLMIVFPKKHSWMTRWLKGTNTEDLLFRTNLPMLAIA